MVKRKRLSIDDLSRHVPIYRNGHVRTNETAVPQIPLPKIENATTKFTEFIEKPCLASVEIAKLRYLCWNRIKWCMYCDTDITAGIDVHKMFFLFNSSLQSDRNVVSQLTLSYSLIAVVSFETKCVFVLEEQSDQVLHCLPLHLHRFDSLLYGRAT